MGELSKEKKGGGIDLMLPATLQQSRSAAPTGGSTEYIQAGATGHNWFALNINSDVPMHWALYRGDFGMALITPGESATFENSYGMPITVTLEINGGMWKIHESIQNTTYYERTWTPNRFTLMARYG